MNKERRKALEELRNRIDAVKSDLEGVREEVEALKDEEQDYYDNMPESLQGGEKGDRAQEVVSVLEDAIGELEGFDFDSVMQAIEQACE